MTIFLALNEVFRAPLHKLKVADFKEKVKSLTDDRLANQTAIRKEFEVRENSLNALITMYFLYEISQRFTVYYMC